MPDASVTGRPRVPAGFGPALYRLRRDRRWSLRRAAGEAGISVTTVMRAEAGENVCLAQVVGLAAAYGVRVGALLGEDQEAPSLTATLTATQRVDLSGPGGPGGVKVAGRGGVSM